MGFAVNAARFVPNLHCLCGHCGILPKKIGKPSIAIEKSFCNSKGVRIRSKQCLRIYKDHFALQNACWEIPNP